MTVSTVVDHNDYTGNGVTTSFPYTFRIFKKTDLSVSVVDLDENITVLVLDTDYTVTNAGGYNGGNVVLTAPLANGWQISIARELEPTQETDLRNQGKFFAEVHEDAFDKLTMLIQQVGSMFRLALRKPSSVANWYDALNNYIRNLKDPRDPQDAATKNYADTIVAGSSSSLNQKIDANFARTLRVPEASVNMLDTAANRAGKVFAWDSFGRPINIPAPSGSAADVFVELAKSTGATLIGAGMTTVDNLLVKYSPLRYGAKADGSNDTSAFTSCMAAMPSGATMDLQGLTYSVTDIEVTKPMRIINGTINVLYGSLKGGVYAHDTSNVHVQNITTIVDYANKTSYTSANVSGIHFENCTDISAVNCTAIGSKNDNYLATGSWGCPIHAYQCSRVSFQNCVIKKGDKEGLMTRFCDEVWMDNCRGYECGQSCIGTSGGNKGIINACYSYKAGNTGITMNNQNSIVTNCVVEGNLIFAGIVIGHSHESSAYANNCLIANNVIVNSAYNGIMVTYGRNITITGNSIENAGVYGAGNGILIDRFSSNNSVVTITGNSVKSASAAGIYSFAVPGSANNITISGNTIQSVGGNGIRVDDDGYVTVKANLIRGSAMSAIQVRSATLDGSVIAASFDVSQNTVGFCGNFACDTMGASIVNVSNNVFVGFNNTNDANYTGLRHIGVYGGNNIPLPTVLTINGNVFASGYVGASRPYTLYIEGNSLASTGNILKVSGNKFGNDAFTPLSYPSSNITLQWGAGNTKGTSPTLVTASIPSSGSVVVNNSNQTQFALPQITGRGNSGFYVSSFSTGTLTINNTTATSMNVTICY
ncbi:right-handed parallel beta-helix repeat-containing protein [Enterobacter cloacae]|uniref:right-handed parallel beta-helix repeat-containing protein n=1 Tax=Enterobacter cloacae TaxID=550 RepID=UPI001010EE22|nr:right-handed parallel beta-helix repeat-containing protein [Enterobacter cloacae]